MRIFRSVRFNIVLFAVLAAASALGTLLPQRHEAPAKVDLFLAEHPSTGAVLDRLGFFTLYHSPWYMALLGLMAFDVVVCKLRSLPRAAHDEEALSDRLLAASPLRRRFQSPRPPEETAGRIREFLRKNGYALRERRGNGEIHLWAAKHRLQRWGDFVLHVSVVGILAGGLFGSLKGFEEFLPVSAGGERAMQNRPWTVAVDEFLVDYYKDTGTPRAYASRLRVLDRDRVVAEKRIKVNDPLDVDGVRFYQASWGMTGMLNSATVEFARRGGEGPLLRLPRGERVPLKNSALSASADMILPDFAVDAQGNADTKSLEPNNPAVLVSFYDGERRVASLWLLQRDPRICFKVLPDQTVAPADRPPFRLRSFDAALFSGLQVTYDPGARIAGWGCVALLLGLALHFYLHQRRLRLLVKPGDGGADVSVGGWSSRGPLDFDPEFRSLTAALEKDPAARPA